MNRYFTSLDGLIIAAEMAAAGDHVTAAKFLVGATKLPEYRDMVQAVTEEQQQNKEQEQQDSQQQNQEQAAVRSPELSAALARVLGGNEMADTYPDSNVWQDQQFKDENDLLNEGSVESASEEQQTTQIDPDDLGIDLDEESQEMQGDDQQEEPASVTAALAAFGVPEEVIHAETASVTPNADLQARMLRNRQVRA